MMENSKKGTYETVVNMTTLNSSNDDTNCRHYDDTTVVNMTTRTNNYPSNKKINIPEGYSKEELSQFIAVPAWIYFLGLTPSQEKILSYLLGWYRTNKSETLKISGHYIEKILCLGKGNLKRDIQGLISRGFVTVESPQGQRSQFTIHPNVIVSCFADKDTIASILNHSYGIVVNDAEMKSDKKLAPPPAAPKKYDSNLRRRSLYCCKP